MEKESRLKLAILLSLVFMIVEVIGGYLSNSIAIFSDAAHLLTDIAGFAVSLVAAIAAKKEGNKDLTYGLARVEVLAALCSVLSLWLITFVLLYEACLRAKAWWEGHPAKVNGLFMFSIAVFGVLVNICLGWVFHQDHGGELHPGHSHSHDHGHCSHSTASSSIKSSSSNRSASNGGKQRYEALGMDSVHDTASARTDIDSGISDNENDSIKLSSSSKSTITAAGLSTADAGRGGCCVGNSSEANGATTGCCSGEIELQLQQAMYCSTDVRSFLPASDGNLQGSGRRRLPSASSSSSSSSKRRPRVAKTTIELASTVDNENSNLDDSLPVSVTLSVLHTSSSVSLVPASNIAPVDKVVTQCTGDHGDSHNHSHSHGHSHGADEEQGVGCNSEGHSHGSNEGGGGDVNLEAAYLHVLTDLIQSIGVALAGLLIYLIPHWQIIDPLCTFIFSFIALYSTFPLLKKIFRILLEGTPSHIDWDSIHEQFTSIDTVTNVHDLHVWSISSQSVSLTCHMRSTNPQYALKKATEICRALGINHSTIQVHDDKEKSFCYTGGCEWEEDIFYGRDNDAERVAINETESSKSNKLRTTLCVTKHNTAV